VDVTFEVAGTVYIVPEPQAAILAENLRVLAGSRFVDPTESWARLAREDDWRGGAIELANAIEETLVVEPGRPIPLDGGAAAAASCVLRLMVGMDTDGALGLRDVLGAPVAGKGARARRSAAPEVGRRQLTRPEMLELLTILFVLALVTVVAGIAWTSLWYVLAPVIAALLGLRVATTRATGRLAWSLSSIVWWAVLLIPATVLVVLVGLFVAALI